MYPTKANINGKIYQINTDYRVALKCLEIINDKSISDMERTYAVIYKLFGIIPEDEDIGQFVKKVTLYLGCGETQEEHQSKKRDIDLTYDMQYIIPSFRSDYGLDIVNSKMHWYEFNNLISGFTDQTIMSRVREIRNFDLSEVKDPKTRKKILQAQEGVALPELEEISKEQQEALDEFEQLLGGD